MTDDTSTTPDDSTRVDDTATEPTDADSASESGEVRGTLAELRAEVADNVGTDASASRERDEETDGDEVGDGSDDGDTGGVSDASDASDVNDVSDAGELTAPLDDTDPSTQTSGPDGGAECPYCGSTDTVRDHPQGPSACRSMHSCQDCGQPFEKFE